MHTLMHVADQLSRLLAGLAAALIFLIVALQLAEIFSRNVLGISLSIVWEIAAYLHVAAIFLATSWTL